MASAEPQRLALHASARRTLGDLEGDTLMALLPPANTEIALRSDVIQLGTELRGEMALLGTELRGEMALLGSELRAEMVQLGSDLELRLTKQISSSTFWTIGLLAPFIIAVQAVGVMMLR
jgi:hypothetical protein